MSASAVQGESERIVDAVAVAVGLLEGPAGVRDVLRTVARLEPVAVRTVSRSTELPVPFVAAICNELRGHGVVSRRRPVQLTARGRRLFGRTTLRLPLDAACPACAGREVVVPERLEATVHRLAVLAADAPAARVELDQTHCTVETKVRRVLTMYEGGSLDDRRVLLLGDDDLTSVAIKLVVEQLGVDAALRRLTVVDVDAAVLGYLERELCDAPFPVELVEHDLREPLPPAYERASETVFTDPPYTGAGGELFLSRAAQACVAGADVYLSFGSRRPDETLALQRAIADMGFVVRSLVRNFNDYLGAGVLGGTSHLYRLSAAAEPRPRLEGPYRGPLYTGDLRRPTRLYRCRSCRHSTRVGAGESWTTIAALRDHGCPHCGGTAFVPGRRASRPRG